MSYKRAVTVFTLRSGDATIGILAPLPPTLTLDELEAALSTWGGGAVDRDGWLSERLLDVTGRRYNVQGDPTTWEQVASLITYQGIRITEPTSGA